MRKYPFDISVSENDIDANLEMVERRDPDNFPCFSLQEWCAGTIPKSTLNISVCVKWITHSISLHTHDLSNLTLTDLQSMIY